MKNFRILTVRQPWASLIVLGHKDIENRTWSTRYRGPLLIHAASVISRNDRIATRLRRIHGFELPHKLPLGRIVGVVRLDGCISRSESPWFDGPVGWQLSGARALAFDRHIVGRLGLWSVELDAAEWEIVHPAAGVLGAECSQRAGIEIETALLHPA